MFNISTDPADRRAPRQSRSGVARTAVTGVLLTLAVIPCLAPAGAAQAAAQADDHGPRSLRVAYGDLNLRGPEGRMVLKRRVSQAARQVCVLSNPETLSVDLRRTACVRHALSQARPQVEAAIAAAGQVG
ncbi:MAG: UrcA family protein [Phenylobacterium sp.]